MISIGIGEIQKKTSLLSTLTEVMEIVDRRKKKRVAMVYPSVHNNVITALAGKYQKDVQRVEDLSYAKEEAMMAAVQEKYGFSD